MPWLKNFVFFAFPLTFLALAIPACASRNSAPNVAFATLQQRRAAEVAEAKSHKALSTFDAVGITSMTCVGAVDWETLLKGQADNNFREEVLPILEGTRFLVTLEKDGTVRVSTRSTFASTSPQAENRARGSIQSFSGVIATLIEGWARFAVMADLPAATREYQLDTVGDHYLVTFKNGAADVAVAMNRSFSMSEERFDTIDGSILTRPRFAATPGGFLVTGWSMAFPQGQGSNLSVDAKYMPVEGVQVPETLTLHSSLPSFGTITLPLSLTNYRFNR